MTLTECFTANVGRWFEREGRGLVSSATRLRQMNMAIALAASRWNELAAEPDAVERMRAWLDDLERRAIVRGADARAEAARLARGWLDDCVNSESTK